MFLPSSIYLYYMKIREQQANTEDYMPLDMVLFLLMKAWTFGIYK